MMDMTTLLEQQWAYLLTFLPGHMDLDVSARQAGALVRKRRIDGASSLLRIAFAYAIVGMPLRRTAAWAEALGIASLSNVALMKRLRKSKEWLGQLLGLKLAERAAPPAARHAWKIRLVDATCIRERGSQGTDWRVHLAYDLHRMCIDDVEVTDVSGGETLKRFQYRPGELVVGDRGYAHRAGLHAVSRSEAYFLIRHNWSAVPLAGDFDLFAWLRQIPDARSAETAVHVAADETRQLPELPIRLVALRKSEAAAEASRKKRLKEAVRRGKTPDPRSLEMTAYVCLLTTVPSTLLSAKDILELYRFRWQVEIAFKRLKGLIGLGDLPVKDPDLARTYLYTKLLGALVLEDLTERFLGFSPWGYRISRAPAIVVDHPEPPA